MAHPIAKDVVDNVHERRELSALSMRRRPELRAWATIAALLIGGCHITSHLEDTRSGESHLRPLPNLTRALAPTLAVSAAGNLQLVRPLVCTNDVLVRQSNYSITTVRPNMATFIVGLISASLGGVSAAIGLSGDESSSSPASYLGVVGLVAGAPLLVGPLIGNSRERVLLGESDLVREQKETRCGVRPVPDRDLMLRAGAAQFITKTSKNGELPLSPFSFVDAFSLHKTPGLKLSAELIDGGKRSRVDAVLDGNSLAKARAGFFAAQELNGSTPPLSKLPSLATESLSIVRARDANATSPGASVPIVQIVVKVTNGGPGDGYGVRGVLASKNSQLDGRIIYFGRIAANTTATAILTVQMNSDPALLRDAEISFVLHDFHNTAPEAPVRFRGPVLNAR